MTPTEIEDDFPMQAVRFLAAINCLCQFTAIHVERNVHWPSCMVGKAQEFLGKPVKFCNPNKERI